MMSNKQIEAAQDNGDLAREIQEEYGRIDDYLTDHIAWLGNYVEVVSGLANHLVRNRVFIQQL